MKNRKYIITQIQD